MYGRSGPSGSKIEGSSSPYPQARHLSVVAVADGMQAPFLSGLTFVVNFIEKAKESFVVKENQCGVNSDGYF